MLTASDIADSKVTCWSSSSLAGFRPFKGSKRIEAGGSKCVSLLWEPVIMDDAVAAGDFSHSSTSCPRRFKTRADRPTRVAFSSVVRPSRKTRANAYLTILRSCVALRCALWTPRLQGAQDAPFCSSIQSPLELRYPQQSPRNAAIVGCIHLFHPLVLLSPGYPAIYILHWFAAKNCLTESRLCSFELSLSVRVPIRMSVATCKHTLSASTAFKL